jgi:hypothetical protein
LNTAITAIEAVNKRIEEAVVSKDLTSLEALYADEFVFTHGTGLVQTKSQWLDEDRFLAVDLPSYDVTVGCVVQ